MIKRILKKILVITMVSAIVLTMFSAVLYAADDSLGDDVITETEIEISADQEAPEQDAEETGSTESETAEAEQTETDTLEAEQAEAESAEDAAIDVDQTGSDSEQIEPEGQPQLLAASGNTELKAASGGITVYTYGGYGSGDVIFYTTSLPDYGSKWPAYCIDHSLRSPRGNSYDLSSLSGAQLNQLGYIMEHGYPNNDFGISWDQAQYLTQAAVFGIVAGHSSMYEISGGVHSPAWIYSQVFGYAYSEGSWNKPGNFQKAEDLYNAAVANAGSDDAAFAIIYSPNNDFAGISSKDYQRVVVPVPAQATIRLKKTGAFSGKTVAGAEYQLDGPGGEKIATFVVGEDGVGYADGSDHVTVRAFGTYTITETKAPENGCYLIDNSSHSLNVKAGSEVTFEVSDIYKMDPVGVIIQKKAIEGSSNAPALQGAQFEISFYEDVIASSASDLEEEKPARIWVYETDEYGIVDLRFTENMVSGDELYYSQAGTVSLPQGTLIIKEIQAPSGYFINEDVFAAALSIADDGQGTWNYYCQKEGTGEWSALDTKLVRIDQVTDLNLDVPERRLPAISTAALNNNTGTHTGISGAANDSITDTVYITDARPGEAYFLTAELADADTGDVIATVSRSTTAPLADGADYINYEVSMPPFRIDASEFAGRTVTVLEYLSIEGEDKPIAEHAELLDEAQTIRYPYGHTTASDQETEDHVGRVKNNTVITDSVQCSNLVKGEQYTVKGKVVYKSDFTDKNGTYHKAGEEILCLEGSENETSFTADSRDITITLTFVIDASMLEGARVVVFEDLFSEGVTVYSHADLNDEEQSIYYPSVSTSAADGDSGDNVGVNKTDARIIDTVTVSGLIEGETYTITGRLMDQESKAEIKQETAVMTPVTFTAGSSEEKHNVVFEGIDSEVLSGRSVVVYEDLVHNGTVVASHCDIGDLNQTVNYPEVRTAAVDQETGDHAGSVFGKLINSIRRMLGEDIPEDKQQIITDTVSLSNLVNGRTYTVEGVLKYRESGETVTVDGEEITQAAVIEVKDGRITAPGGEKTETSIYDEDHQTVSGTIELPFSLDSSVIAESSADEKEAASFVVFESLIYKGIEVASHADLDDEDQSVRDVLIRTTALDQATESHVGDSPRAEAAHAGITDEEVSVIKDNVEMKGLIPGQIYTLTGRLVLSDMCSIEKAVYLKADGSISEDEKEAISVSFPFRAESQEETMEMEFEVGSELVSGHSVTVFECLYHNDQLIAAHADITDREQTIYYPGGETELVSESTGIHHAQPQKSIVLTDTVTYRNLIPGEKYTFRGVLYDKETGKPLLSKAGEEIRSELAEFVPEDPDGSVQLKFSFDGTDLKGRELVAFEEVFYGDILVFTHADINDDSQTVSFPAIKTTASSDTGSKSVRCGRNAHITDTVSYEKLIPGSEYVLRGTLYDKTAGRLLEGVAAELVFTPESSDGSIDLTFTVDTSALAGHLLVVYEELFIRPEGSEIHVTEHKDPDDAAQAVTVDKAVSTGDSFTAGIWLWILAAAAVVAATAALLARYLKKGL